MATFLTDYIYDNDNDLLIQNGDFVSGLADSQYIEQIVTSSKGEWLFHPTVGVGLSRFTNGNISIPQLESIINNQLSLDGYADIRVDFNNDDSGIQFILTNAITLSVDAFRP